MQPMPQPSDFQQSRHEPSWDDGTRGSKERKMALGALVAIMLVVAALVLLVALLSGPSSGTPSTTLPTEVPTTSLR